MKLNTIQQVRLVQSGGFTTGEEHALMALYGLDPFWYSLFQCFKLADEMNRSRLFGIFPNEAEAFKSWKNRQLQPKISEQSKKLFGDNRDE